jgi:hypothetical protein
MLTAVEGPQGGSQSAGITRYLAHKWEGILPKCRNVHVGEYQSVLILINPIISPRTCIIQYDDEWPIYCSRSLPPDADSHSDHTVSHCFYQQLLFEAWKELTSAPLSSSTRTIEGPRKSGVRIASSSGANSLPSLFCIDEGSLTRCGAAYIHSGAYIS